jgi:hypothetical protein
VPKFDPSSAQCLVFVRKAGVFSAFGHDLLIRVTHFEIALDEGPPAISAWFDATSLRVVTAVRGRTPDERALGDDDKAKVDDIIRTEILRSDREPSIRFVSSSVTRNGSGYGIAGTLTLRGTSRSLRTVSRGEGGRQVTEVTLHQPDFGIQPYSAALGGLRVAADLVVRCSVPASCRL